MTPILLQVGSVKLYSFGTFIALGALLGGLVMYRLAKIRRLKTHHFFDTVLYSLLAGLIGSRLVYYFLYQNQFQNAWQALLFWQGGLVALGGLSIGFLVFLYFIKKEKDPIWQVLDISAIALLLAWAVGKFGCHLSACSVGRTADNFLTINGSYPVDLFSAVWALLGFVVFTFIWFKNRLSDGVIFFLALEGLFLGELLIKTLEVDFGEGMARAEAVVLLALIVMLYLIFWRLHGPKFEKNRFGLAIKNFVFRKWPKRG
ncbi:MAG TPA: prolipoprotein diacylglyceryl transferase family protein [Candidatus Saccharimonadales bacterium]|nr:prolipoprotein diacylglyceryl transferase family protein [Candidatus Saccharimonadales bacterium]